MILQLRPQQPSRCRSLLTWKSSSTNSDAGLPGRLPQASLQLSRKFPSSWLVRRRLNCRQQFELPVPISPLSSLSTLRSSCPGRHCWSISRISSQRENPLKGEFLLLERAASLDISQIGLVTNVPASSVLPPALMCGLLDCSSCHRTQEDK